MNIKTLRIVALLEGVSLLLLLFMAMPLKYIWDMPQFVSMIGMGHGVFFMAYVVLVLFLRDVRQWSFGIVGFLVLLSIIPFGTFYADKKYFQ